MKYGKKVWSVIVSLAIVGFLFMGNQQHIFAEEYDVEQEYLDKKAAGVEVYEIISSKGDFMGYYEPCPEDFNRNTRQAYPEKDWAIPANTMSYINTKLTLIKGDKITVNFTQSPSGAGYTGQLALRDADDGTFGIVNGSVTTNGWTNGTITVGYSGHFNFAIQNTSSYKITYNGSYSI